MPRSELLFPERCYQLALTYRAGNFVRYFRSLAELPLLLLLALRRHCDLMVGRAVDTSLAAYRQSGPLSLVEDYPDCALIGPDLHDDEIF